MTTCPENDTPRYTCSEYREEMILAALQRSLANPHLTPTERERIVKEIKELEKTIGL